MTGRSPILRPMLARRPDEKHRVASSLELFFDLVFVVAVSIAATNLHHRLQEHEVTQGITGYLMVFFAIWWAWMNFTWFATSFDTDDWLYRVTTIVQMGGVLVLAAGIAPLMADGDTLVVIIGYVIMRLAMVSQWLRAARSNPALRTTALRYAGAIVVVQMLWVLRLAVPPEYEVVTFVALVLAEIAVPVWTERSRLTPWHPEHIVERYSLFTLIVLGEGLLASTNAVIEAVQDGLHLAALIAVAASTLVILASLWWIYFWTPRERAIRTVRHPLGFGYAHFLVFAAAAAISAGVEVAIGFESTLGEAAESASETNATVASVAISVPVAVFLLVVWALMIRPAGKRLVTVATPIAAVVIAGFGFLPIESTVPSFVVTAVVLALLVVAVVRSPLDPADESSDEAVLER